MELLNTGALALRIAQVLRRQGDPQETDWARLDAGRAFVERTMRASAFYLNGTVEGLDPEALSEYQYVSPTIEFLQTVGSSSHRDVLQQMADALRSAVEEQILPSEPLRDYLCEFFSRVGEALVRERLDVAPQEDDFSPSDDDNLLQGTG